MSHYYNSSGDLVEQWETGAWPSPTTILDLIAKPELEAYRSRVGEDTANELMTTAQERGTRVHKACEVWLEIENITEASIAAGLVDANEVHMLQGFVNWWQKTVPELIDSEIFLESKKYKYRGRCDLVVRLDGELWIIDIKTGPCRWSHGYQLRAYEQAYFETTGEHARMGVLALTDKTKQGYHRLKETNTPVILWVALKAIFDDYIKFNPVRKPVEGKIWKG